MGQIYEDLFTTLNRFRKLRIGEMFPEMTKSDGMTLMAIYRFNCDNGGVLTVSELADRTHAQSPAVSRTLKSLEDMGLIERTINKDDRRNTYVTLTPKGTEYRKRMQQEMSEFGCAVVNRMGEDNMRRLNAYLEELYEVTRDEIKKRGQKDRREQ